MLSILNIDNWETTTTTLGWWKLPVWSVTLNNFVHRPGKNRAFRLSSGEAKGWTGIERMKSLREERSGYSGSGCSAVSSEGVSAFTEGFLRTGGSQQREWIRGWACTFSWTPPNSLSPLPALPPTPPPSLSRGHSQLNSWLSAHWLAQTH